MRHLRLAAVLAAVVLPVACENGDDGAPDPPVWSLGVEDTTAVFSGTATPLTGQITGRCQGLAIGFQGRTSTTIEQLRLTCASLDADGSLGVAVPGPSLGSNTAGAAASVSCPMVDGVPTVLVADAGLTNGTIHQTNGRCRLLTDVLAGLANDTASLRTGVFGGSPQGSEAYATACPAGSVITGLVGRQELAGAGRPVEIAYLCRAVMFE